MKNNDILIKLNDASIYRSNKVILQDINLLVRRGDFIYLTGKTGSGKSSLLETLYADAPLKKGSGEVVGFDLNDKRINIIRKIHDLSKLNINHTNLLVQIENYI